MFSAAVGIPYEQAATLSMHGRKREDWEQPLLATCRRNQPVFLLLSGGQDYSVAGAFLTERGQGEKRALIGYDLGLKTEEIRRCLVKELVNEPFRQGMCMLCILPETGGCAVPKERLVPVPMLPDSAFERIKGIPMTKQEIRCLIFGRLSLREDSLFFDIGSGTGSIAVTAAKAGVKTVAFERNKAACRGIEENAKRHQVQVQVLCGEASQLLEEELSKGESEERSGVDRRVTDAFIGGSGGKLREIYRALIRSNPQVHIVVAAMTMETLLACYSLREEFAITSMEVIRVQVSCEEALGRYHRMMPKNETYIISL